MKTLLLSLLVLSLLCVTSYGQNSTMQLKSENDESLALQNPESLLDIQKLFKKNQVAINIGIGYGLAGIYGTADFPPISLGIQYGIENKISIGGIVGYSQSTYDYGYATGYKWTYRYVFVGARGEYHFLESAKNLDGYAGLTLGYSIVNAKTPTTSTGFSGYSAGASYFLWGAHAGIKYYFSPKFGIFAEAGYGTGYFTGGITFNL